LKRYTLLLFNILTPKERNQLFVMAGLDFFIGLADVGFLMAMVLVIRIYTGGVPLSPGLINYSAFAKARPVIITGIFLLLFCIKNLCGVWLSKAQHSYVYAVASRLSNRNINAYLKGSYMEYVNVDSSVRIRQISQVPIEFGHYILTNIQQILAQCMLIVFTIIAILLYHPTLFVLLLILLFPPVILLGWFTRQKLKSVRAQIKQSSTRVIQYLQESLSGYIESNIYHKNDFFANRYHTHQQQLNKNLATLQTLQGLSSRFFEVFALLGFFILILINQYFGGNGTVDILTIGIFMAAAYKIIPGVVKISNSAGQMRTYGFTLQDLAVHTPETEASRVNNCHIKSIRFDGVGFKFKDTQVINNLNFELIPGDMAGISGVSGRGKTTVVNLLLGFLEQEAGDIFINNQISIAPARQSYWNRIAYVKQQSFFINDTILKNITLNDDIYNNDKLTEALYISGLHHLLNTYPEGINKMIHEHGKNISGGQRQRVALARALYHDFDLLILDEPFSEMDEAAEREILTRVAGLKNNGSMVLLITHNQANLSFCNKIIYPDVA
jgi:ABC-type bacteriocin/lantibiotic exporter with double-glycine peptidase domain